MNRAGWAAALLILWLGAWGHSTRAWLELEQYRYGWAIPPLAIFIAWRRWPGSFAAGGRWASLIYIGGLALFARGAWLAWLDPSWRMTGALLTAGAAVCTASWFYLEGGRPLLRRQLFALGFCFLALPWPKFIETPVRVAMLQAITSGVVACLNFAGIAAAQEGNVIQLHATALGMETACSGIESLQAAIMAAIFLGELNLLSRMRRLFLLGAAVSVAMAFNFARVTVLAGLLEFCGPAVTAHWHDTVGATATTLLFLSLIGLSTFGARKAPPAKAARAFASLAPAWAGWGGALGACSALLAGALLAPPSASSALIWKIEAARLPLGWVARREALTPFEESHLHRGMEERWHLQSPDGGEVYLIYLHWNNDTQSDATAYPHSPGLCLPSQGWTREGKIGKLIIEGDRPATFDTYRFSQQTARLVALQCLSSGGVFLPAPSGVQPPAWKKVLASLCRRPRYVSEDLLIYLPETGEGHPAGEVATQIVTAFRVAR